MYLRSCCSELVSVRDLRLNTKLTNHLCLVVKSLICTMSCKSVSTLKVKSLEQRLRITEERFHQERADRAGKLSQVEEDLIKHNARLQVLLLADLLLLID